MMKLSEHLTITIVTAIIGASMASSTFAQGVCPVKTIRLEKAVGQVIEVGNRQSPVPGTIVELFEMKGTDVFIGSTRTNSDGTFDFENVEKGQYRLVVYFSANGEPVAPKYDLVLKITKNNAERADKRLLVTLGPDCFASEAEIVKTLRTPAHGLVQTPDRPSSDEGIKREFLTIIPGVSTKADVVNLLGPISPVNYSVHVKTEKQLLVIDFSTGKCDSSSVVFPEWIVDSVTIFPSEKHRLRLDDVVTDKMKFAKRKLGDVLTIVTYYNRDESISIEVDTKLNRVETIEIRPSEKLKQMFPCNTGERNTS